MVASALMRSSADLAAMIGLKAIASLQWIATTLREARGAIEAARSKGILAVEMEAFACSADVPLRCLAHVTNTMGQDGKGRRRYGRRSPYWIALSQPIILRIDFCLGVSRNFYADCLSKRWPVLQSFAAEQTIARTNG
jgi:hypothetical protein